ncbi:MAG TPA: hypothetical protein VHI13_10955 [Candidatus Kapabacteria bacterium]|nr:hypothetical protein [Candidatus Kapabacteria bacterium]
MPLRNHLRFTDIMLNSAAGATMRAQRLSPELAASTVHSIVSNGVTFDFYQTSSITVGPIVGPNNNIWFAVGTSVGQFVLPQKTIQECPPTQAGLAQELVTDLTGNIWFGISFGAPVIGRSTPGCNVTTYPTNGPTSNVVLGPNGNIYFSDQGQRIGSATPAGIITEFPTTYGTVDPIVGPGNAIWFGEFGPRIGKLTLPGNQVTEWTVTAAAITSSLLATPDGSVWYGTDLTIGRITPGGQVQEYPIGNAGAFNLLLGPDGNVWFGCQFSAQVGKVTPAGQVSLYNTNDLPMGLAFGSDNKLYVGQLSYFLSVVDLNGNVNNLPLTGAIPFPPHLGPDGNIWFSGNPYLSPGVSPFIGCITPAGVLTEFQTSAYPNSFLNAPDGSAIYMGMNTARFGVINLV